MIITTRKTLDKNHLGERTLTPFQEYVQSFRQALTIRETMDLLGISHGDCDKITCLNENHTDSNPSMHVYDDHLYCFGCGTSLDAIDIVKQHLKCSLHEAVQWIAEHAGMPHQNFNSDIEKEWEQRKQINQIYRAVYEDSVKYRDIAEEYLSTKRGISPEVSRRFVGYLPPEYSPPNMDEYQVGGLYSDAGRFLFSGYMIFTITRNGMIEDLYGRYLGDTDPQFKHRRAALTDPPRRPCFWNLDECKRKRFGEIYLTEGIIKAMALINQGKENTIAMIGIKGLSPGHAELLEQCGVRKVNLVFDTDSNGSGQEAAIAIGEALFIKGFEVSIITLPKSDDSKKIDIDEYFLSHSLSDFQQLEHPEFFSCICERISKSTSLEEKMTLIRKGLEVLARRNEPLIIPELLNGLKKASGSGFTLEVLKSEFQRIQKKEVGVIAVGKSFLPDAYADEIMGRNKILYYHNVFYVYQGGVYKEEHELLIKREIQDLGNGNLNKHQIDDVYNSLKIKTFISPELVNVQGRLNLKNGILDLVTGDLLAHTPEYYSTLQTDLDFDPLAICPLWREHLNLVLPVREEQYLMAEMFGYCLVPDTSLQKGFLLYGEGNNGKSVCTDVLEAMVGEQNCGALELKDFGNQFRPAQLKNKLINISGEQSSEGLVDDAIVKKIISGDPITVEKKYENAYRDRLFARFIVNCNILPKTRDKTRGWYRRWIIIPFKMEVEDYDRVPNFSKEIIKTELSGVLNWALLGLMRLRKNGDFSIPPSSSEALEEYKQEINPTLQFMEERLYKERDSALHKYNEPGTLLGDIYGSYKAWCENNGYKPLNSGNLAHEVEKYFHVTRKKKTKGKFIPYVFIHRDSGLSIPYRS